MTVSELKDYLFLKPQTSIVAINQKGSPLIIPISEKNIVVLETAKISLGTNLWHDGRGAFSLKERYNYLLKQRGWRELP